MTWSVQPPTFAIVVVAGLYVLGARSRVGSDRHRSRDRWRALAFGSGLAVLVAALDSPIDTEADRLFTVHMVQHVLLLSVAPPLIVLGAPWARIWRPLPLGFRRAAARALVVSPRTHLVRRACDRIASPACAWVLFCGNLVLWHVPALYDATLRNGQVHDLEHALFFSTGILFWAQVIPSAPFRVRLDEPRRAVYSAAAMLVGWVLAIVLASAREPLYHPYATLLHRPGGLSALADQQIAAGVMWVPGSLAFTIAIVCFCYRWIGPDQESRRRPTLNPLAHDPR